MEKSLMYIHEILYVLTISINSYLYTFKVSVVDTWIDDRQYRQTFANRQTSRLIQSFSGPGTN